MIEARPRHRDLSVLFDALKSESHQVLGIWLLPSHNITFEALSRKA